MTRIQSAPERFVHRLFGRLLNENWIYINAAAELSDLKVPPGNNLEALKGNRKGQHSIRINDQFRICFN